MEQHTADYEFRLRFNLANGYRIGSGAEDVDLMALPTGVRLKLRTAVGGTPIKDHARASVRGGPYASTEEARVAAERAKLSLLCWAVEQRLGIDFGDGRQRGGITEFFRKQLPFPVRNDIHGIDVYERVDNLKFFAMNGDLQLETHLGTLVQTFEREFVGNRHLTDKQILASEIYSASFFDSSPRSRFITLVTAVEALIKLARRPEPVQMLVAEMESMTRASALDAPTKDGIVSSLQWIKDESIGESGRALSHRLLPDRQYDGLPSWDFFKRCYNLRSQIMHSGRVKDTSVDMLSLANTMERFVSELLLESWRESA